jgi:SAM-dependent methyltransferase
MQVMRSDARKSLPKEDSALIIDSLPSDSSWQTHSMSEALKILRHGFASQNLVILDLGCGVGGSFEEFSHLNTKFRWIGLDLADSPEVRLRKDMGLSLCTYDGVHVPLANNRVDLVYSHQVFEHVRQPAELLAEVHRILRPGGYFVGSTSHLEPFHSRSVWNFTPYGFSTLLSDVGFRQILLRPGIDGITLISRRLLNLVRLGKLLDIFFSVESPLNLLLEFTLRMMRTGTRKRNLLKLLFCGHFCFLAQKWSSTEAFSGSGLNVSTTSAEYLGVREQQPL